MVLCPDELTTILYWQNGDFTKTNFRRGSQVPKEKVRKSGFFLKVLKSMGVTSGTPAVLMAPVPRRTQKKLTEQPHPIACLVVTRFSQGTLEMGSSITTCRWRNQGTGKLTKSVYQRHNTVGSTWHHNKRALAEVSHLLPAEVNGSSQGKLFRPLFSRMGIGG